MASGVISAVKSFTMDSMIRRYHVYKDIWSSFVGEVLYCRRDVRNYHDPFTVKYSDRPSIIASSSTWVRYGRVSLSFSDRDKIAGGVQLNDKQINYTQSILKCQFSIPDLQSTLLKTSSISRVNKLQIVQVRGNHWITASTMMSEPNTVNVYDSLYDSIDEESFKIMAFWNCRFQRLWTICKCVCCAIGKETQGFSFSFSNNAIKTSS